MQRIHMINGSDKYTYNCNWRSVLHHRWTMSLDSGPLYPLIFVTQTRPCTSEKLLKAFLFVWWPRRRWRWHP